MQVSMRIYQVAWNFLPFHVRAKLLSNAGTVVLVSMPAHDIALPEVLMQPRIV